MPTTAPEILDVLIVGAGISGIGAARHLQKKCPDKTWRIVEARERLARRGVLLGSLGDE